VSACFTGPLFVVLSRTGETTYYVLDLHFLSFTDPARRKPLTQNPTYPISMADFVA
jgi:hypothetical protein